MAEDRELGWDEQLEWQEGGFVQIPPGDYSFTIDHYERGRFPGNEKSIACNTLIVFFNIRTEGDPQIRETYFLRKNMAWKIQELFVGLGLMEKGADLNLRKIEELPGLSGRCEVSLDLDKKDPEKKYNHIKKVHPKGKGFTAGKFG